MNRQTLVGDGLSVEGGDDDGGNVGVGVGVGQAPVEGGGGA